MNKLSVIIVAAGKGLRMGAKLPKQFLSLSSRPILMRTIDRFAETLPDAERIVALSPDAIDYWKELCVTYDFKVPHKIVAGGETRFESVRNCVETVSDGTCYVLIHDGVRPFVSEALIHRVIDQVKRSGAVVPSVDVVDSLRRVSDDGSSVVVSRANLKSVQTPQAFQTTILKKSYQQPFNTGFTDDASVVEACGYEIAMVEGERSNLKITTEEDLLYGIFFMEHSEKLKK